MDYAPELARGFFRLRNRIGENHLIDTWKDAFTIVGGFVATAATVVTISRGGASKGDMQQSQALPPDILASLTKLAESNQALQIQVAEICRDMDHFKGDFKAICKRMENDHMTIKLLRETLIAWGRLDAMKYKQDNSATETGEI